MTTYTFPSITPNSSTLEIISNTKRFISPLSGATQTASRDGTRLRMTMEFTNLTGADRSELQGFLALLDGQRHRCLVHDHSYNNRGDYNGGEVVDGSSQTGNTLVTDGWTGSGNVKRGDQFSVAGELKIVTQDGTHSGGSLTINFVPEIHSSPGNNVAVDFTDPQGTWMLDGTSTSWVNRPGPSGVALSDVTVVLIEDITI